VRLVIVETAKLIPAQLRWQQKFRQQAEVVEWLDTPARMAEFTTAPLRWSGQVVGFVGEVYMLLPERRGLFTLGPFQYVSVTLREPHRSPTLGEQLLIAGRVAGTTMIDLPLLGPVLLPTLSLVALVPSTPPDGEAKWVEEPRVRWRTLTYDEQGKLHDATFYTEEGQLRWRWQYTYTEQGRRLARTSTDTTDVPRWTIRYRYDAAGRLQEKLEFAADQSLSRHWHYTYNAQGLAAEEANYDANDTLLWKWRFAYNAHGQRIEESNHTADGTLLWKRRYLYNAQQQVTGEHQYDAMDKLMWRRLYTYDPRGNRLEEILYKGDGSLDSRWRYTYDAYDSYGNWRQRTESKWVQGAAQSDLAPVQVTYRTLIYY
jgi:YD repeat-containing protein